MIKYRSPIPDKCDINIEPRWLSFFMPGQYRFKGNMYWVDVYPPKWIPTWFGLRDFFTSAIINHELGHVHGIKGCDKMRCLMFEAGDSWWEILAYPLQLLYGFNYCDTCKDILVSKEEKQDE